MLAAIRNWVIKTMMKDQTGVVRTLPKPQIIELNTQMTAERIMRSGINPEDLKTIGQVENVVNQIDTPKVNVNPGVTSVKKADVLDMEGNKIPEGSKIMGGKQVESDAVIKARIDADNKKGIASIKNQKMVDDAIDNASPGFAGDRKYDAQLVADDLANKRFNKDFYDLDQKQQMDLYDEAYQGLTKKKFDPPEDLATGGRVGLFMGSTYSKGTAALREILKYFGKKSDVVKKPSDILRIVNPKQFNRMLEDPRIYGKFDVEKGIAAPDLIKDMQKKMMSDRQSTVKEMLGSAKNIKKSDDTTLKYKNEMIEELMAKGADKKMAEEMAETISKIAEGAVGKSNTPKLTEEGILQLENILKNMETGGKKPRDLNADGGRIGYKVGSVDKMRRLILKAMGAGTAGIAAAKSGIFSGLGKGATKQVAKEVAQQTTSSMPPPYFFELANKIKTLGKPDKVTYADRVEIHRYKGKNGDEYELIEDLSTGDMRIQKDKTGIGSYGDKTFDTIEDRTVLEYRKGDVNVKDEGLETQKSFKEADEYEEYKVEFDQDGTEAGADDIAANVQKEIIEEAGGEAPSIKYASGGLAYMLGE